jgi:hypothetical protein
MRRSDFLSLRILASQYARISAATLADAGPTSRSRVSMISSASACVSVTRVLVLDRDRVWFSFANTSSTSSRMSGVTWAMVPFGPISGLLRSHTRSSCSRSYSVSRSSSASLSRLWRR